jgi:hypothetical protein
VKALTVCFLKWVNKKYCGTSKQYRWCCQDWKVALKIGAVFDPKPISDVSSSTNKLSASSIAHTDL